MLFSLGALLSFAALFLWGVGDFLIQKTTRHIGDWETLFLIVLVGTVIITPFVYTTIISFLSNLGDLAVLFGVSVIMFAEGIINFEALKKGKIAVIEPVLSLELPIIAVLSLVLLGQALSQLEYILIIIMVIGLSLVSLKSYHFSKSSWLERGLILGIMTAALLGVGSFLVGFGSRITNPLVTIWFIFVTLTIYTFLYLAYTRRLHRLIRDIGKRPGLILATALMDNFAWIAFAIATVLIPITIAAAISENYIAVAALLGLVVTKEKFMSHQKIGLVLSVFSAVALALLV